MDYTTYSFSLTDLKIELPVITKLMNYTDEVPEQIVDTFHKEMTNFLDVTEIRGGLKTFDCFVDTDKELIEIGDLEFNVGQKVCRLLRKVNKVSAFICTAGNTISDRSKELMSQGDILEGYVVDVIGSVVVEKAMDLIHEKHKIELSNRDLMVTNRYSPGYCEWHVREQKKLFSLFPEGFCDVNLTDSCLMMPIKSVSGFIGVGSDVKFHKYTCDLCNHQNCIYKNKKG